MGNAALVLDVASCGCRGEFDRLDHFVGWKSKHNHLGYKSDKHLAHGLTKPISTWFVDELGIYALSNRRLRSWLQLDRCFWCLTLRCHSLRSNGDTLIDNGDFREDKKAKQERSVTMYPQLSERQDLKVCYAHCNIPCSSDETPHSIKSPGATKSILPTRGLPLVSCICRN